MKFGPIVLLFMVVAVLSGCGQSEGDHPAATVVNKWFTDRVFEIPESCLYDAERDIIFVSNIKGATTNPDENGYISKLRTDGAIEQFRWATGLHAPKGMGIYGDKLYVADIFRLVEIDLSNGQITGTIDVGARFLNDVAIDDAGVVYVSDNLDNKIYRFENGEGEVWLDEGLDGPNGLWLENGHLWVASAGSGWLRTIDLETGAIEDRVEIESGLDGIQPVGDSAFVVSCFPGAVWYVTRDGSVTELIDTRSEQISSADIGFVPEPSLILVPTFHDGRVAAYELTLE